MKRFQTEKSLGSCAVCPVRFPRDFSAHQEIQASGGIFRPLFQKGNQRIKKYARKFVKIKILNCKYYRSISK